MNYFKYFTLKAVVGINLSFAFLFTVGCMHSSVNHINELPLKEALTNKDLALIKNILYALSPQEIRFSLAVVFKFGYKEVYDFVVKDLKCDINGLYGHFTERKTPLGWAAYCDNLEAAEYLCTYDSSIKATATSKYIYHNSIDCNRNTPLHLAACKGHKRIVEYLCPMYSDEEKELTNSKRNTPLIEAVKGYYNISIDAPDRQEQKTKFYDTIKCLLDNKVNVSAAGQLNQTALHLTAKNNDLEVATLLVPNQANKAIIEAKDQNGETPLHLAAKCSTPRSNQIFSIKTS